jgi:hypothetical protein
MVVCVSGSGGKKMPWPKAAALTVSPQWMHRAPTRTTNEQPPRESDCSETKAKQSLDYEI